MNASERIKRNKFSKKDNQLNKPQDYFSESYISELNNDIGSLESWKSTDELGQLRKKFSTVMLDLYRANDTSEQAQKLYNSVKSARDYLDNISNEYSKYASADEYNAQMKLYEEQQKHYENLANSSEATFGWEKYLADLEASKQAENSEKEDEKWYEAIGRYLYGSGGSGTVDSTLPTSNVSVAVGAIREDDSYKKPQDTWSEKQKQIFGALYMSNPDEAYQYAIYTNNLNDKAAEAEKIRKIQESATSNVGAGLGHTVGTIVTAPLGLADYLDDLAYANVGRAISPDGIVSPFEYSQAVTGGISSHLNTEYGTLEENIPIFGGKGLGDIYGLGTSVAQSMASAYTLGGIGTLVSYFGQGAASGVDDALSRGASDEQAFLYGTALGVFEGLAEKIGVDNLFKLGSSSTIKGFIKNILKQAGAEGTEEGLTSLLSNIADNVIMQDKSNFNALVKKYMSKGMSETDAKTKAWLDSVSGIAFDTIAGAASGGISGTIHTTAQNIYANKQATQLYGDSTADLVSEALDLNPNNKYAKKMQNKLESGKKLSGGQINRLIDENEAIIRNSAKVEETSDDSNVNTTDTDSVENPSPTPQNTVQQAETTKTAENTTVEENATESEFKASEDVSENETVDNAAILEEASKKYGSQAQAMIHTYNKGQDVYKYDSAYKTAYDMGKSGVSLSYAKNSKSTAYLTDSQKELAYEAGKSAADTTAKEQDAKNKSLINGKTRRKKGTLKGEGVTISDLRKSFNDTQNKAYKILSTYAEVTGIDIVLYKSETDEDGNFIGSQGKFKWSEDKIYIDINAGLTKIKDVNDLAKHTMLRTFSHEFTHFIEKWNPIWYNEFRKVVFDTLTEHGENVHDLIETKMSMNEGMTYNKASREVVAEAMTDILPDANFVETLATKHKNIFDKLLDKLKEFLADLKAYFKTIGHNPSKEANALKEQVEGAVHYVDNIVKLFDKVALEAVENYQKTVAIEEKTEKIDSTVTNNDENISKSAEKVQKAEEVTPAKEDIAENATTTNESTPEVDKVVETVGDAFTITDNTEFGTLEIRFDGKPSEDIRNVLKEHKFRWHGKKGIWYGKGERADIVKVLQKAYQIELATNNIKEENKNAETKAEKATNIEGRTDEDATGSNERISTEDGNGRGISERDGELLQEPYKLRTGQRGELNQEKQRFPDDAFIVPKEGTIEAEEYAKLAKYGIEGYVVKKSAWDREVQAFALNGKVYLREGIDEKYRGMVGVHEATHIMKHLEYQPYLDFIDRVPPMLDISSKYALHLIKQIAEHYNIDVLDMSEIECIKIYDELNAWLYGSYTVGLIVGDTRKKLDDAFYDFDTYIKELSDIHEQFKKETKTNVKNANNERPILEPDTDGERASRLLDESQTADVRGTSSERNSVEDTRQRESETSRNGDRVDTADRVSGSNGNSEVGDLRRNDELTEQETQAKAEELAETVEREIEQKSTEKPKGNNFVIGNSLNLPDGEKARFRANIDAIRLIKQLETEGRYATTAEQEILSKYVGWGGLDKAFGEFRYNRDTRKSEMTAKDGWEKEFAELKSLVDEGIITEKEYKDMSASTKNAHYTSIEVIKAMYDGLASLGFKGGRMLEPSSGVGNFVGAMPTDMSANVNSWTMVELDRITGLIAKYLYPNADVRIQGFENANIPDNYIDVAIGNVPFGNFGVVDRTYPKRITKAIHNYFFAKSIDKVRPGGIVMFITSSFTMNAENTAVRQYIMERADLLGAIRLPNTAFKGNAGTEVVTDILILKKRESGTEYAGEDFLNADYDSNYGTYTSNYFKNHPEMVLGKPVVKSGMYGSRTLTFEPFADRGTIDDQIREAFKNIKGKMSYPTKLSPEKTNFAVEKASKKTKSGGFVVHSDGSISRNENGQLVKYDTDEKTAKRIAGMLAIRDAYRTLANYLQQGQDAKYVKQARTALNKAYDTFVKEYGYINSPANRKAIDSDPDSYSILSLENYDAQKKTAKKADIFTKDTISANKTINHVNSVEEGVIASINLTGRVDISLIAKLTDKTAEDVTREIIDSRLAFKNRFDELIARETYLSGNVRAKLREAEALVSFDSDFENNIEELRKVIPTDIPYNEIYITPGATFIPNEIYADFIAHMLGGRNNQSYGSPDVEVGRTVSGEFKINVNNKRLKNSYYNTQTWGTARKSFLELIDAMMGSRTVKVNDVFENADGKKVSVVNEAETEAANEKVKAIQKEFEDWIWKDENRREALARLYNETFNAIVNPKYDGSHLSVNGINADYSLREHQANAVHRIISSGGNTLLAHRVGAGKTLEMAAAAMKMRELGVIKKPVFVVPKSVVAQWGVEFHSYFPAARLLVADDKSFTPANRKIFTNKIANGDYDAVIVSYEQFEKIPMSVEYQARFYEEQINEIIAAIAEEKAESRDGKGLTVKEMEKKRAQLEKKLKELTSKPKDENNVDFEMLGIDSLFVDEAHNFKNLEYVSKMSNVAGLGSAKGSQRAFDLYTKIRYLQGLNGGRGVVFATATPVMNSMVELYIMQRYLQPDILNQLGLKSFDAWAKQFGEVVNKWEINPSGTGMRQKQVFANFRNLNELQLLFRSFADVLTEVPGLKIPKMKGGAVKIVECEPGEFQKNYMQELQKRAENVKNVDPSEDNMLKITSDGRKVSYTQRMIDPTLPYEPNCKIFKAAENILKEYQDSTDVKGTQIVFLDMATPKGTDKSKTDTNTDNTADDSYDEESARLYDDMRDYLVKKGIPKREIAFIHEADSDAKRKQLFEDVNNGKVRVLIGSTGKMGVGMNAQKRVVAIHHLDAPWRPGDVEQRDGRAFRQKNINDEVSKYVYVTKGSFDSRLWDILDRKQHFINQIMNGEDVGRTAEDTGEVTLSAAEVKALASGNPLIEEQTKLTDEIKKLENLQKAYNSSIRLAKTKLSDDETKLTNFKNRIARIRDDIATRVDTYSEGKFSMTVGKQVFSDKKEAGAALAAAIVAKANADSYVTVGKFAGFELRVIKNGAEYNGLIHGKESYKFNIYLNNTTRMVNHIGEIIAGFENMIKNTEQMITETTADRDAQNNILAQPFEKQDELNTKRARFNEVMELLAPKTEEQLGKTDTDTVQEQSRKYLDKDISKKYIKRRKVPPLDEFSTAAMQWAYSDKTNIGEQKLFYRNGKWVLLEKSDDGFVEISTYAAERYDFINKEIKKHNEELHDRGIDERVYRSALRYESLGSDNSRNNRNDVGQQISNGRVGDLYQGESESNGGTDNEESKSDNRNKLSSSDDSEQYQQRTNTLTDREVLEIAANEITVSDLTQAESDALTIFQNRLSKLKDLQAERTEQGRLYKEQQFGEKVDRAKATETLNRMHILDDQIKKATAEVLTVEEKEILKRVLKKARKVVEVQERQHGQEILKRWRERRDNAVNIKKYKDRILSDREELIKWLKHPLEKNVTKHVNENVKDVVINFLASIDTTSARKLRNGIETKEDLKHEKEAQDLLSILNNLDDEVRYSGDYDLPLNFTSRLETHIKAVQKLTEAYKGEKVLNRMSVEELRGLSIIIANLKTALTTMNKFHANAMFAHVTEAGNNTVSYLKELRDSNGNGFENFVMWKSIRPAEVWKRFGKGGISIERALRKGQDKLGLNAKVIIDFAKDTFTAKERKSWDTSTVNVTLSDGRNVKLTVSALMSFYELSKRKQGRDHILNGGVTVADVEIRENKKKQRVNGRYGRFTEADIDIMNSKLTDKQKEVADKLQQFMEKQGGEWGNYVTLARFGEKAFGEVGYFPISVDKQSLSTQNTDNNIKGADLYRLLNMGFTKELSSNTNQPLMLYSIFDVFSTHMSDMAQYNAMALPVLDAIRWLNYKTFDYDTKAETSNLRAELKRAYGSPIDGKGYAENFIVHILKAYNSSEAHSTPEDALGIKFMHNYNRAQVAFNLRVVVQQPMSITRAALIINPKYITKALNAKKLTANIEDMLEHSGIAVWKDLGYYDINISRGLTQMIKQDKTHLDKITDLGLKPAEFMDKATWGVIWYACKLQLADQGITDYKQIEELFDEVIYRTQVVDSVLTKSQYMRDTGFFARASSAFMSESVTVASSVLSAYDDFQTEIRKGSSIGKAFGTHKKAIVKTMLVCSVSAIMLSVVQAVADALRDDDDYEKLYEKWLEAFKSNLIDEFSPLNKLPLFKYIEDIIEVGLDIFTDLDVYGKLSESAIAQWFDTLTKALEITKERLDGNSNYTLYALIYKYFQVLSGISGIPASAAMREVVTIWNNTFAALLYPELKVTTYEPSELSQIRYAYEDGYLTADEAVKEMFSLTSKGYSEENIRSQAKSQIGEWYSNDEISKQQTVNMLDRYFDMESDEIDANISYWDFKNDNPDIDVNIGWFEKYYSDIADSGISIDEYVDYRNKVKDITGEDKKSKRMKIINSLPISKSQKDALYLAEGWSESKLYEAPWH